MPLGERQVPNCALAVAAQAMVEACATMDGASQTLLCSLDGAQQGDPSARPSACSHTTRALADRSLS